MILQVLLVLAPVILSSHAQPEGAASSPAPTLDPAAARLREEQAANKNARYFFSSDVEDQTRDFTQHRDELREGLKVKGSYSYNDGFLKRRVVYEADENGYRVISDEIVPVVGPKKTVTNGFASIRTNSDGTESNYTLSQLPGKKITS